MCEKQAKELQETSSKCKLLEQIHVDTVSKFYAQLEDLSGKLSQRESELEEQSRRASQLAKMNQEYGVRVRELSEQLGKCRESVEMQEREIDKLRKELSEGGSNSSVSNGGGSSSSGSLLVSTRGWNKEVKHLDARINDVLDKIKEREMSLNNGNGSEVTCKLSC